MRARNVLILGSSGYVGKALLQRFSSFAEISVTGCSRNCWSREAPLPASFVRPWQVVIDTSAFTAAHVAGLRALEARTDRYLMFSSIAATTGGEWSYARGKAAAESEARAVFGARAHILQLPFIVGPGDPRLRLQSWAARILSSPRIVLPDAEVTVVFLERLVEEVVSAVLQGREPRPEVCVQSFAELARAICRHFNVERELVMAAPGDLDGRLKLERWSDMPMWIPSPWAELRRREYSSISRDLSPALRSLSVPADFDADRLQATERSWLRGLL
jgi:nucleoside-diphosphate-sugar epimerase